MGVTAAMPVFVFVMMIVTRMIADVGFKSRYSGARAFRNRNFHSIQRYNGERAPQIKIAIERRGDARHRAEEHVAGYSGSRVQKYDPATGFRHKRDIPFINC
jgi:hypothetical protein